MGRRTPADFRFSVKAQRGGSWRAFSGSPDKGLPWLTDPYRRFGERLGTVLFRAPDTAKRDDERLGALLDAWPRDLPLTLEFRDPSWAADEVVALRRVGRPEEHGSQARAEPPIRIGEPG